MTATLFRSNPAASSLLLRAFRAEATPSRPCSSSTSSAMKGLDEGRRRWSRRGPMSAPLVDRIHGGEAPRVADKLSALQSEFGADAVEGSGAARRSSPLG